MDTLPSEMLEEILRHLEPADRLSSARTNRRWAQLVSLPHLMEDILFTVPTWRMRTAANALINAQRRYRSLKICGGHNDVSSRGIMEFDPEFWEKIGGNLQHLKLRNCKLSIENLLDVLRLCPNLTSLHLQHASCFGSESELFAQEVPCPDSFACLKQQFVKLDFSYCRIDDRMLIHFVNACSSVLEELHLCGCHRLTGEAWAALGRCSKLRRLFAFWANGLKGHHLENILHNNPEMKHLDLRGPAEINADAFESVVKLRHLQYLGLPDSWLSHERVLRRLGEIPSLRQLDFEYNEFHNKYFSRTASLKNLRVLRLSSDSHISAEHFGMICENFTKLERLHLGKICQLTDSDTVKLQRLGKLKHLYFDGAYGVTDATFERGLGSPVLETLSIERSPLTNVGLAGIAAHHARLESLCLSNCNGITDEGMVSLLDSEPHLRMLQLYHCTRLTDATIAALALSCPKLRLLGISQYQMSETCLDRFRERRPRVRIHRR